MATEARTPTAPTPTPEEKRLLAAGWEKVSPAEAPSPLRCWLDPHTGGPTRRVVTADYQGEDRKRVVRRQLVCPPAPWHYTLAEALEVQRERDALKAEK